MYFIQNLLLNLKLIQQISQIFSYITFITKFNCTLIIITIYNNNNNNDNK